MKTSIKILKILFAFLLGLAIGTIFIYHNYATSQKPYEWKTPPIVVNCYGPDLTEAKIKESLDFWQPHGDSFEFIVQSPSKSICKNDLLEGFILIKKVNSLKDSLAKTKVKVRFMSIRAATIRLEPGVYRIEWLLEHEIGHAFGYKHVEKAGHVMHPYVELMGGKYWVESLK